MRFRFNKRQGYTLLELMIVVALMTLVIGTASVKLVAPYRIAQAENLLEQLRSVDRLARQLSRRQKAELKLHVFGENDTLFLAASDGKRIPSSVISLKPHFEFLRFRQLGGDNQQVIAFNRYGQSPSYAIELRGRNGQRIWLVFAGLSGQALQVESEAEIEELL